MIAFGTLSQEIGSKSQEIMRDDHHFKNGATELVTKEGMQMKIVRNRGSWYGKVNGEDQELPTTAPAWTGPTSATLMQLLFRRARRSLQPRAT